MTCAVLFTQSLRRSDVPFRRSLNPPYPGVNLRDHDVLDTILERPGMCTHVFTRL